MKNTFLVLAAFLLSASVAFSQTLLTANAPGNTYERIDSVLAPSYSVVEVPDCNHNAFGRHIEEVFDTDLNKYVFKFIIHVTPDNDRCINTDRQRNEIKTYDKSPANTLAVLGEKVIYKWKFKLDNGFQPSSSFTHLHQIKAVGGSEDGMPLITLTARKSNPDRMELRYAANLTQVTETQVPLSSFIGKWVEATETIFYGDGTDGTYELIITDMINGNVIMQYSNAALRTWKTNASFCRPKWGIYRSLNNASSLRDEELWFTDFSIEEVAPDVSLKESKPLGISVFPNPTQKELNFEAWVVNVYDSLQVFDASGATILNQKLSEKRVSLKGIKAGVYFVQLSNKDEKTELIKIIKE